MSAAALVLRLHAEPGAGPGEGHAWVTLTAPDGAVQSLSFDVEVGLRQDGERDRPAVAVRSRPLDPDAVARIDGAVAAVAADCRDPRPAAAFAASVWAALTGEALAHRRWGVLPCPGRLAEAIAAANADTPPPPEPTPRPRWSPNRVGDCVAACAASPGTRIEGFAP